MYRLLALAKYDERYVIPPAHAEQAHGLEETGHRVQPGLRGRSGHGRFRAVRRELRRTGCRSPWRTSTCCATGRPPTAHGRPRRQGQPGEPAQLGRQGPPRRAVPAAARTRTPGMTTRRRTAAWQASRCCSATPTSSCTTEPPCLPTAAATLAGARRRRRSLRFLDHLRGTPPTRARRRLRCDVRPPQTLLPVPHLLRPRRHPQTRHGPAGLKQTYAAAGLTLTDEELPDHLAVVLEFAATGDRRRAPACWPSTAPAWNCCAWPARLSARPGPTSSTRSRPRCPRWPATQRAAVARLAAAGPARGEGRPGAVRPPKEPPTMNAATLL